MSSPRWKKQITFLLEDRHKIPVGGSDDFSMTSTDQITATIKSTTADSHLTAGRHRRYFIAGRGHRGDEHHAGLGDGKTA